MRTGTQYMCGCYYLPSVEAVNARKYLPQVDLKAHTTVISSSSRTMLSQTFVNPSSTTIIKECRYIFPLYDGVTVVGFTCQVGPRIIKGVVKEKAKAKEDYDAAVERGETAGLLEQGVTSDVFVTNLGNILAGEKLFVTITYIAELKYDVGAAGTRFTIPTRISPRYGSTRMDEADSTISKGGIAITVDVQMPEDSAIQELRSPSHPIAVILGKTSASESQHPHLSRASASLSLGTSTLDKDFILEIINQDSDKSKALLETHTTTLGQRALMANFVLKAPVQQSKPEIIFVADQSSSMRGTRTKTLVAALRIFLKSLPVGIKFNICYFGTFHSFLFHESQVYDQNFLEKALRSLDELDGDRGGTETLKAIQASVESRDNEQPLSLILATDGDIWQQQELFDYLNDSVATSKKNLRVFALGIGNSVSSAMVEGVARAGKGFAQSVGHGEKLDGKVIRMLRGALTPDHGALTMEVQYQKDDNDEDDFVMVERVSDSLRVLGLDEVEWTDAQLGAEQAVSAEITDAGRDGMELIDADGQARDSHLPVVPVPKLMQTPQKIPPLYPFSRTIVYVLISPEAAQGTIKSVVLKGSSPENPLKIEVPVEALHERGETIHQLAAKHAVTELEEGRGWLVHAKDEKGVPIIETYTTRHQSMVEHEAVRLGIQYQIAGKFTSFIATETVSKDPENTLSRVIGITEGAESLPPKTYAHPNQGSPQGALYMASSSGGGLFGGSALNMTTSSAPLNYMTTLFSAPLNSTRSTPQQGLGSALSSVGGSGLNMTTSSAPLNSTRSTPGRDRKRKAIIEGRPRMRQLRSAEMAAGHASDDEAECQKAEETDELQKIIALQTFEGCWEFDGRLVEAVGISAQHKVPQDVDWKMWATVLAITFLKEKMAGDEETWVMVVEKARGWLKGMEEGREVNLEENWTLAKQLIMEAD